MYLSINFYIIEYQKHIRQQTTANDYSRQQTFIQRLFLDKGCFFAV